MLPVIIRSRSSTDKSGTSGYVAGVRVQYAIDCQEGGKSVAAQCSVLLSPSGLVRSQPARALTHAVSDEPETSRGDKPSAYWKRRGPRLILQCFGSIRFHPGPIRVTRVNPHRVEGS